MSDGLVPRSIRYLFDCINQARQGVSDGQTTFRYVLLLEGNTVGCSRGVTSSTDPKCEFCLEDICVLSSWCYFVVVTWWFSWCCFQYRSRLSTGSNDAIGKCSNTLYNLFSCCIAASHYHHYGHNDVSVRASFAEIYNEQVYDLLNLQSGPLQVRWNVRNGFFVQDLFVVECENVEDVMAVVSEGHRNRYVTYPAHCFVLLVNVLLGHRITWYKDFGYNV